MRMCANSTRNLFVVVLTMHQDFEYIQEALRLGAIDYIAKVELERDSFGTVLCRIRERIEEERRNPASSNRFRLEPTFFPTDKAWVLMADIGRAADMADRQQHGQTGGDSGERLVDLAAAGRTRGSASSSGIFASGRAGRDCAHPRIWRERNAA